MKFNDKFSTTAEDFEYKDKYNKIIKIPKLVVDNNTFCLGYMIEQLINNLRAMNGI